MDYFDKNTNIYDKRIAKTDQSYGWFLLAQTMKTA